MLLGHAGIELLDLLLVDTLVIVVGRGKYDVGACRLVQTRGVHVGVVEYRAEEIDRNIEIVRVDVAVDLPAQPLLGELGAELVVGVVVVYAVGEPHLFEILLQCLEVGRIAVVGVVVYSLQRVSYDQIVFEILVEKDVASALGGLRQIVYKLLLSERQTLESGNLVADDLDVVEAVDDPRLFRGFGLCGRCACGDCKNSHDG